MSSVQRRGKDGTNLLVGGFKKMSLFKNPIASQWTGQWLSIAFLAKSKSCKTDIYQVISKEGILLGDIKWCARWRKYAFYPDNDTVFEQTCLNDIAEMLEILKQRRKMQ
jgi:hypothetical protein